MLYVHIYIYKEELKTVVHELLAYTHPKHHKTSTALWNPYRRMSSRGRRAQIRFSQGAQGEKPEKDCPAFLFYGESIRTSVHSSHGNGGNAKAADGVVAYNQGCKAKESLSSRRGFSLAGAGKPKFCPNANAGCYIYKCRCCCSEYPCNSSWPTVASSHLWDARESS